MSCKQLCCQKVEERIIALAVTETLHRLEAIQDRWDALREAKACFAKDHFESGQGGAPILLRTMLWPAR